MSKLVLLLLRFTIAHKFSKEEHKQKLQERRSNSNIFILIFLLLVPQRELQWLYRGSFNLKLK